MGYAAVMIEWIDEDGNVGSASWGDITDVEIDKILLGAQRRLGPPDTTT